jgi:cytochrome c556
MRRHPLLISALLAVLLSACGETADTHPGQPVSERRAAFKKILLAFEPMGISLRDKQYRPDQFVALAAELSRLKEGPWRYFGADSNYPPTRAKASVWSEAGRFEKARQDFLQSADRLLVAAESGDENRVAIAYQAVYDSCRDCHKTFRD